MSEAAGHFIRESYIQKPKVHPVCTSLSIIRGTRECSVRSFVVAKVP
jgi:hypothetical protein